MIVDNPPARWGLAQDQREDAGRRVLCQAQPKPPKTAGEKVEDDGEGGKKIAQYLVSQKII